MARKKKEDERSVGKVSGFTRNENGTITIAPMYGTRMGKMLDRDAGLRGKRKERGSRGLSRPNIRSKGQ